MIDVEAARVLARLSPDAMVQVTIRVGDLVAALEAMEGGPPELSTRECAKYIARTSGWWSERAPEIEGAYQDEGGRWRIPNRAARDYYAGRQGSRTQTRHSNQGGRIVTRGPRKPKKAAARA